MKPRLEKDFDALVARAGAALGAMLRAMPIADAVESVHELEAIARAHGAGAGRVLAADMRSPAELTADELFSRYHVVAAKSESASS